MTTRYFDDFNVGDTVMSHGVTVTEAAIIDFALKYDPQRFHIDTEAAAKSPYGGLIASGFQTMCLAFRMFYQMGFITDSGLGSPGLDDLRWLQPVRPGDIIRTKVEVKEKRASRSRPDRGILKMFFTVYNQRDEEVMTYTTVAFILRKPG